MNKCAVCTLENNVVVNIIVALPTDPVSEQYHLVEILDGTECNIGWVYYGQSFLNPELIFESSATGVASGSNT